MKTITDKAHDVSHKRKNNSHQKIITNTRTDIKKYPEMLLNKENCLADR